MIQLKLDGRRERRVADLPPDPDTQVLRRSRLSSRPPGLAANQGGGPASARQDSGFTVMLAPFET